MWKYRHIVKENLKSGYDWSETGQRQTAFCVCQREHWECRRPCAQSGRQSKNAPIESWNLMWNWHSLTDCTQIIYRCTVTELWLLTIPQKKRLDAAYHNCFNDDSWVLHGKTKGAMKTYEVRRNYKERRLRCLGHVLRISRRQDTKTIHTVAYGLVHQKKSRKAEIELDWHCNSRFEVNWHGMGRCRASSSWQRRLSWTCDPMCLWHRLN